MDAKYNHTEVEKGKYEYWLKNGFFNSGDKTKEPFSIVIPPPNVTGKLHLGHAWNTTLQDIIIRRKRMQGYDALWLPGMDHAGIATQARVDQQLRELKINKYEIGREKFLEYAWKWKEDYAKIIRDQWAILGLSLDYNKERFTLDEGLNKAVNHVFISLYNKGLIYRGKRIINWDTEARTALSNIEVEHKETKGHFYYFIYPFIDGEGGIEVATTRPETMFADQAIMVHPNDERYTKYIGRKVYIPDTNIIIPVIADSYVDQDFKTGCVKVTPAHDPNDFEVGLRHNLDMPLCMNDDGTMNSLSGKYEGLDRFECRKQLVENLKKLNLCTKIEEHVHQVGYSERTNVIVEPRLSLQWFVKMKPLAENALNKNTCNFVPPRFVKIFNHWLENINDWCISRQLWWGHSIPAWYYKDEVKVQEECPGKEWKKDEDVLDTWFSSALWPFSTLGWPNKTEDLKRYFPNNVLVTAYDIIFFWVSRMIFQSIEFTDETPFKEVLIHGLIRDKEGRKMSKSLGNGIDPIDMKEKYGIDTLRYFLSTNTAPGLDLRFDIDKVESSWNYINKLWNIGRYIKLNTEDLSSDFEINLETLNSSSKWILTKLNNLIEEVDKNYEKYEFGLVSHDIYNFVYDDFASWYIELSKVDISLNSEVKKVLVYVYECILKMLHPFIPFVTEEIYQNFNDSSIMVSKWVSSNGVNDIESCNEMNLLFEIITSIRNLRNEVNKPNSKKIDFTFVVKNEETKKKIEGLYMYLEKFTNPFKLECIIGDSLEGEYSTIILDECTLFFPLNHLVDKDEEIKKIKVELENIEKELARSNGILNNESFIKKAPVEKIEIEKEKQSKYIEKKKMLIERLNKFM